MTFYLAQINFYAFSAIFNGLLSLFLVPLLLFSKQNSRKVRVFLVFLIAVFEWSIFYFAWLTTPEKEMAEFFARTCMIGVLLMAPVFLHFTCALIGQEMKKFWVFVNYAIAIFFISTVYTPLYVKGMRSIPGIDLWPIPGPIFSLAVLHFMLVYILSHIILWNYMKKSDPMTKLQIKYTFIGTFFGGLGGASNFLSWYLPYPPVFNILTSVYVVSIFYAISRYRLMGIEMILRKGMIYGLITAVMSVLYFIVIYLSEHFFKAVTGFSSLWFTIPAIFILALLFEPTMAALQGIVDRTFFRSRYIAEKISRKFAEGVKKLRTIEDFARFIARSAYVTLKLKGSAAFAFDERKGIFVCLEAKGSLSDFKNSHIQPDDPAVRAMSAKRSAVIREEAKMPGDNMHLCVPSLSSGKSGRLLGFLAADTKRDNTPFSVEEIELLEMLANQTASGIENALLYEQQIATIEKSLKLEKLASLGEATADVAHEANNALGFISAFAQMLPLSTDKPEFIENYSQAFPNEVGRIKLILQGIQDYSKQAEQVAERISLKDLADETIVLVRDQAKGKNVIIDNAVDASLHITADRNRMKQVFLNLFMNAIEAMPSGGILSVRTEQSGQELFIKVADTGTGIPKETLRKIFEPFYTTKKQGTGLGLAIVKRIIEENKGRLTVDSEPGKGTTFTLAFQS